MTQHLGECNPNKPMVPLPAILRIVRIAFARDLPTNALSNSLEDVPAEDVEITNADTFNIRQDIHESLDSQSSYSWNRVVQHAANVRDEALKK